MIQLSTFTATGIDVSAKTAAPAAPEGLFASLLDAGAGEMAEAGGKILPVAGKVLPVGLPVEQIAPSASLARTAVMTPKLEDEPAELPELVHPQIVDLAEPVVAELVEPVSVGPVEVIAAAELADTAQPDGETADQQVAIVPLPLLLEKARSAVEADTVAPDQPRASTPDRTTPERQPAQQAPTAATAPMRPPLVAAPLATLAKAADPAVDGSPVAAREPAQFDVPVRARQVMELKLDLAGERQATGRGDLAAARLASPAQAQVQVAATFDAPAITSLSTDATAGTTSAKPAFDPAASIRPQDLTTLVDRLVEARQNARASAASVTVMHADFGEVSLRFGHDNGNLTVSLANNDPGFVRAVAAAVATDGSSAGETPQQGERRDGGQSASARTAADSNLASNGRGTGGERDARDGHAEQQQQARSDGRAARRALGGIFA